MKKDWLLRIVALAVVLTFVLTSCGADTAAPEPESTQAPAPTKAAEPSEEPAATEAAEATATTETASEEVSQDEPVTLRVGGLGTVDCWNPWACQAPFLSETSSTRA